MLDINRKIASPKSFQQGSVSRKFQFEISKQGNDSRDQGCRKNGNILHYIYYYTSTKSFQQGSILMKSVSDVFLRKIIKNYFIKKRRFWCGGRKSIKKNTQESFQTCDEKRVRLTKSVVFNKIIQVFNIFLHAQKFSKGQRQP